MPLVEPPFLKIARIVLRVLPYIILIICIIIFSLLLTDLTKGTTHVIKMDKSANTDDWYKRFLWGMAGTLIPIIIFGSVVLNRWGLFNRSCKNGSINRIQPMPQRSPIMPMQYSYQSQQPQPIPMQQPQPQLMQQPQTQMYNMQVPQQRSGFKFPTFSMPQFPHIPTFSMPHIPGFRT